MLVDSGQDGFPEYVQNLRNLLKDQEVSIGQIIITHWHQDHIGGLSDLESIFDRKYYAFLFVSVLLVSSVFLYFHGMMHMQLNQMCTSSVAWRRKMIKYLHPFH